MIRYGITLVTTISLLLQRIKIFALNKLFTDRLLKLFTLNSVTLFCPNLRKKFFYVGIQVEDLINNNSLVNVFQDYIEAIK